MSTKKLDRAQIAKLVADAGKSVKIADADLRRLIERIADILPPLDGAEEEKVPAQKKQFVVLISDPARTLPDDFALACWALQMPEDEAPQSVEARIIDAAHEFNDTKRGRMVPVQTIGEAIENVPAKIAKCHGVWFKNRVATYALVTHNEIPNTPGLFADGADSVAYEIRSGGNVVRIDGNGINAGELEEGA